jgi:hypothetical protein
MYGISATVGVKMGYVEISIYGLVGTGIVLLIS